MPIKDTWTVYASCSEFWETRSISTETLASFDGELRRHLSYEAISLHIVENGRLLPAYAAGLEFRVLALLECAMGAGFLGRGAEARKPALNESTKKSGGRW